MKLVTSQPLRMEFIPTAMRGKAIGGMPLDGGGVVAGIPVIDLAIQFFQKCIFLLQLLNRQFAWHGFLPWYSSLSTG